MTVRIDHDGPVMIVTIDRPAKRNAVDPDTAIALREAFAAFAADASARVAILTGSAGHFCAGFDLGAVGTSRYDPDGPGPMGPTRMLLEKPVIAAIEGHAVAAGSNSRCGATCASPRKARCSASIAAAGACR